MTFGQSVRTCFRNYATFRGRARRSEYWWFALFLALTSSAASAIDEGLGFGGADGAGGPVSGLWGLATFLPALAVGWRRLHDTGRPGWLLLVPTIVALAALAWAARSLGLFSAGIGSPEEMMDRLAAFGPARMALVGAATFIPAVALIVMLCQPGERGANRYGPEPEATPA
ncbi:MAG: DUF805 domain-containing protein [Rhodobacteraceae bacterium]|nr:DUF805 domain-containing protein [Paracoccaceae bacterium]